MTVSCCLLGYGRIGKIHFKNIMTGSRFNKWKLSYIVERESEIENINNELKDNFYANSVKTTTDLKLMLSDSEIECVIICTPTYMHFSNIMDCLKNGKHVFCEKPIDENIGNIRSCYDLAESKNLNLFCAFNRRFDNEISKLKTNIHTIGNIHQVISITRDYPYPHANFLKTSSGLFNDCAIHDIDFLNWILDDKPISVYASGKISRPEEISANKMDDSSIIMEYKDGKRVYIYCSRISKSYDQRVEIFGDRGNLKVDNPYGSYESFIKYDRSISFINRYEQSYINELNYFYNVMIGKETSFISKEDCINNLIIVKACEKSFETKKKVLIEYNYKVRDYTNASVSVKNNYLSARKYQTLDYVKRMHKKYLKFDLSLSMEEIFEKLSSFIDVSDPDIDLPNMVHLYESAEACRKDGQPEWFQFITLIHDIGKIMYIKGNDEDGTSINQQWGIVGDTFLVGCKIPESIILTEYNKENPDMKNSLYNTELGIYKENCGLENTLCSWGHDEYLYQILLHNNIELPPEALYIIRYHSLYLYHEQDEYQHLMNEKDNKYKDFLKIFNKYDLYSKPDSKNSISYDIKNYYKNLIKKFIPNNKLII